MMRKFWINQMKLFTTWYIKVYAEGIIWGEKYTTWVKKYDKVMDKNNNVKTLN